MKPTVYRGAFNLLSIYCDTQNGWQSMQAGWDGMQSGEGVWTYYFFRNCESFSSRRFFEMKKGGGAGKVTELYNYTLIF